MNTKTQPLDDGSRHVSPRIRTIKPSVTLAITEQANELKRKIKRGEVVRIKDK